MLPPFRIFIRSRRCHTEQPLHCQPREINLAISLRFLSYSPATEREHYAVAKVMTVFSLLGKRRPRTG